MTKETQLKYGYIDHEPVVFSEAGREAWTIINGRWQRMNYSDALHKTKLLSLDDFTKTFPQTPSLPSDAFH